METNAPIAALHVASTRTSSATVVASVTASAVMAHLSGSCTAKMQLRHIVA
jgi:hypothetical protein